jgi:hypothetical protein
MNIHIVYIYIYTHTVYTVANRNTYTTYTLFHLSMFLGATCGISTSAPGAIHPKHPGKVGGWEACHAKT